MKATKIAEPVIVAIIGMPGSGTTIIASFVNSIERALIFGEPRRASNRVVFKTKYGDYKFETRDKLDEIIEITRKNDLIIGGYKEVWNVQHMHLIDVVEGHKDRLDAILVVLREPRRNYSSMRAMKHNRGTRGETKEYIIDMYTSLVDKVLSDPLYIPIIYDLFLEDPIGTINAQLCWGIVGSLKLEKYVGGGHSSAMRSSEILSSNPRPPSGEAGLDKMVEAYKKALEHVRTSDCQKEKYGIEV